MWGKLHETILSGSPYQSSWAVWCVSLGCLSLYKGWACVFVECRGKIDAKSSIEKRLHRSIVINIYQYLSILINIDQYWSLLIKENWIFPMSAINIDQYWTNIDKYWSMTSKNWKNAVFFDQHRSILINIDQHQSILILIDRCDRFSIDDYALI